jgi:hypothetical protein
MRAQEAEDLSKPNIAEISERGSKSTAEGLQNFQDLREVPRKGRVNRRKPNSKRKTKPIEIEKASQEEGTAPHKIVTTITSEAFDEAILC